MRPPRQVRPRCVCHLVVIRLSIRTRHLLLTHPSMQHPVLHQALGPGPGGNARADLDQVADGLRVPGVWTRPARPGCPLSRLSHHMEDAPVALGQPFGAGPRGGWGGHVDEVGPYVEALLGLDDTRADLVDGRRVSQPLDHLGRVDGRAAQHHGRVVGLEEGPLIVRDHPFVHVIFEIEHFERGRVEDHFQPFGHTVLADAEEHHPIH
jgi:hypothetical protein